MLWQLKDILRSPDTEDGVSGSTASITEDNNLLNEEVETPEIPETPEGVETIEEPEEEPEKPEEVKTHPVYDRPTIKQINEKFPDFFKTFPSLRDMYFREVEYSTIFPTIDDAKEAAENNEVFQNIREDVLGGSISRLFTAVKESDEKSLDRIAENLLPTLNKISPEAHLKATLPLMQNIVKAAYVEGKRTKNENLANSAEFIADYLFNDHEVASTGKSLVKAPEISDEQKEFNREKGEFEARKFSDFDSVTRSEGAKGLFDLISSSDKDGKLLIDPDGVLSEFIKQSLIERITSEVNKQMLSDAQFQRQMQSLWVSAKKSGYTAESKSRLVSAFLARAKSLVPTIRAKYVAEALGTSSKINGKKREIAENSNSRKETGSGRDSGRRGGQIDPRKVDWSKTSDLDLFDDNVTFKK